MNGIPSYLNPLDTAAIQKSLVDDRLQQVNAQITLLKTAPAAMTDEQIDNLLRQMADTFTSQMLQILESR